jgi:hypothetical protein
MRIGNLEGDIDRRILDLGFEVVNECKLLGFRFTNNQSLSVANKDILIEKIGNVIRFWTRLIYQYPAKLRWQKA